MVNSLQIIVQIPMFEQLKFPANSMMVTKELIKIATFDLIPTELLIDEMFYFPESEAFSLSLETSGVESTLFIRNIGFVLIIIIAHMILCALHAIFYKL